MPRFHLPMQAARSAAAVAAALVGFAATALAQAPGAEQPPSWAVTLNLGAYVFGNRLAVKNWLRDNAYGATEPKQCGFDPLFRLQCDPAVAYPRVSESETVAAIVSVRRTIRGPLAVEVFAATEQSGDAIGRCDDRAVPKDPRCTARLLELTFGGGSFAALGVVTRGPLHLGVGPALFLANWRMKPAHLPGLWLDATLDREPWPWFVRAQYRIYRATNLAPETGFTAFHPSTLYIGAGFIVRPNNSGS